jgi:hypothetical protein
MEPEKADFTIWNAREWGIGIEVDCGSLSPAQTG